jgi:hypothetical protein
VLRKLSEFSGLLPEFSVAILPEAGSFIRLSSS